MGNALEKAQKAARKAIESTYAGVATVSEYKKVKDPNTALPVTRKWLFWRISLAACPLKVLQQRYRLEQWQPFHRRSSCSCHLTIMYP